MGGCDPYGTHTVKCGRCGDSYSATGMFGGIEAKDWLRRHKTFDCDQRTEAEIAKAEEEITRYLRPHPFKDLVR